MIDSTVIVRIIGPHAVGFDRVRLVALAGGFLGMGGGQRAGNQVVLSPRGLAGLSVSSSFSPEAP